MIVHARMTTPARRGSEGQRGLCATLGLRLSVPGLRLEAGRGVITLRIVAEPNEHEVVVDARSDVSINSEAYAQVERPVLGQVDSVEVHLDLLLVGIQPVFMKDVLSPADHWGLLVADDAEVMPGLTTQDGDILGPENDPQLMGGLTGCGPAGTNEP